jgi:hypothetical protein
MSLHTAKTALSECARRFEDILEEQRHLGTEKVQAEVLLADILAGTKGPSDARANYKLQADTRAQIAAIDSKLPILRAEADALAESRPALVWEIKQAVAWALLEEASEAQQRLCGDSINLADLTSLKALEEHFLMQVAEAESRAGYFYRSLVYRIWQHVPGTVQALELPSREVFIREILRWNKRAESLASSPVEIAEAAAE